MKFRTFLLIFIFITAAHGQSLLTALIRFGRQSFNEFIKPQNDNRRNFKENLNLQKQFPADQKFFCDVSEGRSKITPASVHKLRPGDIDIIGAIGDSLTAANGAFANNELQVILEGRGVSWSIGGQKDWRSFLTLPNIIKEFNPKLYGFPTSEYSLSFERASLFNVAEPGAMSVDTVHQAKNLVKRMRVDKNVNMKKHWKLITYMIGANNFCLDICYSNDQNKIIENAARDLKTVLRILKENLPRTLVNVVLPPDVSVLTRIKNRPNECRALHYFECPCMFSLNLLGTRARTVNTIMRWNKVIGEVVNMPEFHDRNDFEVNLHRFLEKASLPTLPDGSTDLSYVSTDCFHLSQKGHATIAKALWNSMLTAPKQRLRDYQMEKEEFKCPSFPKPFLTTIKNS